MGGRCAGSAHSGLGAIRSQGPAQASGAAGPARSGTCARPLARQGWGSGQGPANSARRGAAAATPSPAGPPQGPECALVAYRGGKKA